MVTCPAVVPNISSPNVTKLCILLFAVRISSDNLNASANVLLLFFSVSVKQLSTCDVISDTFLGAVRHVFASAKRSLILYTTLLFIENL